MDFVEFRDSFDFDEDFVIDDEVGAVFSRNNLFVGNLKSDLFMEWYAAEFEFVGQGGLVDGFEEAGAKNAVDFNAEGAQSVAAPIIAYVSSLKSSSTISCNHGFR